MCCHPSLGYFLWMSAYKNEKDISIGVSGGLPGFLTLKAGHVPDGLWAYVYTSLLFRASESASRSVMSDSL